MELIQYPQENNDKKIVDKIIALENTAWPQCYMHRHLILDSTASVSYSLT